MAEVLKKGRVIRIVFAVVVRASVWHGEIDEFQALAVFGLFDSAFGVHDDAGDSFDMWIKSEG